MSDTAQFDQILLSWDDFRWCGDLDIPMMGHASNSGVELGVNTKDEEHIEPCDEQVSAWRRFVESGDLIYRAILDAGFSYYTRMRLQYAKAGGDWIKNMPEIADANTLAPMITLSSLTITWPYDDAPVQIGVSFGCDWDREHGFGVVVEGDKVVDVGSADCAIV
ncbi:MAG: hypothetical protein MI807_03970 [Verrucomicrobiales bacterium]|nr:hypothetical protein [Verrucomicrobiales bacterium]